MFMDLESNITFSLKNHRAVALCFLLNDVREGTQIASLMKITFNSFASLDIPSQKIQCIL